MTFMARDDDTGEFAALGGSAATNVLRQLERSMQKLADIATQPVQQDAPDLIIKNFALPDMTGYEVRHANADLKPTFVVLVTSNKPGEQSVQSIVCTRESGHRRGLNVYLPDLDEVEANVLQTMLGKHFRSLVAAARHENAERRIQQLIEAIAPEDPLANVHLKIAESTASLRKDFLERTPVLTSAQVHEQAGFPGGNASQTAHRWRKQNKIFAITLGGRELYPAFQFDETGRPRPIIKELLEILSRDDERTEWDNALWFAGDSGWLDGRTPIDCLDSDRDAVINAAEQEVLRDER